jgi:hypothetical protein
MRGDHRELDDIALKQGEEWAERMFSRLLMWDRSIPSRWPGTRAYARALVLGFARHIDPVDRERLVAILYETAVTRWRGFGGARSFS